MYPKFLPLLERCIEAGLSLGFMRATKHNEKPSDEQIFQAQQEAIMHEFYENFEMPVEGK